MKINSTHQLFFNQSKQNNIPDQRKQANQVTSPMRDYIFHAYRDFNLNINFKARLNRTPEDFYSQKFNQENMPDTVRNYLNEDYEERQHMPPSQLQREAFKYIKIADSVEEVKEIYQDEDLFKNLRPFSETRAKRGTLFLLRWDALTSNTPVFKDKQEKDLSLYLLKKVYLEGKTLEEINKDFANDATDEIKRELGNENGNYFSYADLKSMGIKYPKQSYYQSFLATRDDKEYIPVSRKTAPRTISEEHLEKLQDGRSRWWQGLDKVSRDEQIQKMLEGKEFSNSTYSKFQGQIMTIAAAKIGFSEKLSQLFADRFADDDFNEDFTTFAEKQRAIMNEFWNKDSEFKKVYSDAILTTIAEFEEAYNNKDNTDGLEKLLNRALELKTKVLEKAKEKRKQRAELQKLAPKAPLTKPKATNGFDINSKKEILKLFRQQESRALQLYPDLFKKEMLEYLINATDFKTKQILVAINRPDFREILEINKEAQESLIEEVTNKIEEINQRFNLSHTLTAKTNDHIMNNFLYELTGEPLCLKGERGDTNKIIQEKNLENKFLQNKDKLNKQMKQLARTLSDKDTKEFFEKEFMPLLNQKLKNGFEYYPMLSDKERAGIKNELNKAVLTNPANLKATLKHLSNYYAPVKFLKNPQNSQTAKDIVFEKMATDYIFWFIANQKKQYLSKNDSFDRMATDYLYQIAANQGKSDEKAEKIEDPKTASQNNTSAPTNDIDVDFNSVDSLKKAFKKISKKQCKYYSNELQTMLTEYLLAHPAIRKEVLTAFLLIETNTLEKVPDISLEQKKYLAEIAETKFIEANKEFDRKYPIHVQANEFSLNQTLFELTKDPDVFKNTRADDVYYINDNNLQEEILSKKPVIEKRYKDYSIGLSDKNAGYYLNNEFNKDFANIYKNGFKYHKDISKEASEKLMQYLFTEFKMHPDESTKSLINFIKRYKGAIKFIADKSQPQEVRELVKEHIVYDYICEKAEDLYRKKEI